MTDDTKPKNGSAGTISLPASGLSWQTVVLILATGAGNFITTQHGNTTITAEQQQVYNQVREMHREFDDFKRWQQTAGDNQRQMMQNDTRLIQEIHEIAVRLDR